MLFIFIILFRNPVGSDVLLNYSIFRVNCTLRSAHTHTGNERLSRNTFSLGWLMAVIE